MLNELFNNNYKKCLWGYPYRSGKGSDYDRALAFATNITRLYGKYNCSKVFDASCGDMYWIQHILQNFYMYHGNDISDYIVKENEKKFGHLPNVKLTTGSSEEILKSFDDKYFDISWFRHTIEHIPTQLNIEIINEMIRTSKYVVITSSPRPSFNIDYKPDGFAAREVNLNLSPYKEILGTPIEIFKDVPFIEQYDPNFIYYGQVYKTI